ncbi:AMP-binding protein [Streptomyces specialis]|uniref:AMP-binding protein n=1 Tax=Streptomyces specialis TaxID=498367 RepID=UPI00073E6CF1|nr:AMP-binding protein [Streptomyces specialis]
MPESGPRAENAPWLTYYPAGGPHDVPVPDAPLTALLDDAAEAFDRRTALVFFGRRTRYGALRRAVDRFAAGLRDLGVSPGDRVALVLPNCPQFVVAFYAVLRIGAVAVPVGPRLGERELRHLLADSGAVAAVVVENALPRVRPVLRHTALKHVISTSLAEALPLPTRLALRLPLARSRAARKRFSPGVPRGTDTIPWHEVARHAPGGGEPAPGAPGDLAVLQYTGGTTGPPKGVMLTHRNLLANAHQVEAWHAPLRGRRETLLAVLPFTHAYGLTLGLGAAILGGARTVLVPTPDTGGLLRAARRWKPTLLHATPPVFEDLLARPPRELEALRTLRGCVSGALRLSPETVTRFGEVVGRTCLVEGYGLTEAAPVVLVNPLNANARPGTVGIPLPGTEVRVAREDDPAADAAPGEAGELLVRGPQVFAGYWNDPAATAARLRDGWLMTGDIAVMSPDGFVTLIDRRVDVIDVAGTPVFPSEIERVLCEHPAVREAAVIGVPDPAKRGLGQVVRAVVVMRGGHAVSRGALMEHCAARLPPYKVPTLMEFRGASLPRGEVGKMLRRELREPPTR